MSDDVLLRFLSSGLIDVSGDDTKLEKLRTTASDLAGALTDSPAMAAPYALVAFDPQTPPSDPVIKEALEALKKRWATYMNTFSGPPVAVVRAMLLDALAQAAESDDRIGVGFVTSARNALPFMEVGDEKAIWADVVSAVESKVDARAESEWATPASISVPALSFEATDVSAAQLSPVKIKRDALHAKMHAAAGPQAGGAATNGNPYWPNQNQQWATEFGTRIADAVAEVIEDGIAKTKVGGINVSGPLKQLAGAVSTHVENTLKSVSNATAGLQRRTNLLWWKEALYSPSARVSYRDLAPEYAAALMALDLHQQVPTFSPASVTAFLSEAVRGLPDGNPEKARPVRDLTLRAREAIELAPLRSAAAALISPAQGRGPLLALIAHPHAPVSISDAAFRDLIGVPPQTALSLPAWATWLFRELQAARAASEGHRGATSGKEGTRSMKAEYR